MRGGAPAAHGSLVAKSIIQQPGNYRLLSQLGRGGFADVYLGEHVYLKTQVAIKVLRVRPDDDTIADFLSKASAIARLKHPHIVDILEFDIKSGIPFLVMHYAPNGTLRQRHPKGTRVPFAKIMAYVKQAAAALQYAHNAKQIHGDVKPENMLLGNADEVLLSDFGLAPVAQQSFSQAKGRVAGTVTYMAPEQLQGKLCPASDQYALGIVVYEWLCGGQPFHGTFTEIATQHALVAPPPLRERCPDIPPEVEQVVLRALAKDQQKRFASIQHFALALEQALQQTPGPTMAGPASASTTPMAKRSFSRRSMLLGLTGLAALGGGFAWAALSGKLRIASTSTPRASIPAVVKDALYTYHDHTNAVISLAWSPDGTRIASGGKDGTVQVWQA
jgi:serine/threonine protein kinase